MSLSPLPITPAVMRWAREQAGFSTPDDAAAKIGRPVEDVVGWESGTKRPTMAQLRNASEVYRRPVAVFFMPSPPAGFATLRDFRTLEGMQKPTEYGPALTRCIHEAQERQAWLRDARREEGAPQLAFVGSSDRNASVEKMAQKIREKLGIAPNWAEGVRTRDAALRLWVEKVEEAQVVVFQDGTRTGGKIGLKEARGFVLTDAFAPVIFLNKHDGHAARLFTLAHELAHLWINAPGVSNLDFRAGATPDPIELFCNQVAAEVIAPASVVRAAAQSLASLPLEERVQALSDRFKISEMAMARRLHDFGMISRDAWLAHHALLSARFEAMRNKKEPAEGEKEGGPNYYTVRAHDLGRLFLGEVIHRVASGAILGSEAAALIGGKVDHLPKLAAKAHIPFRHSMEGA